jgi:hypothetical protein
MLRRLLFACKLPGGVGQGSYLGSTDVGDASRVPGEREIYQAFRDLPCVYGLAEETSVYDH